jgi:hypothetical protein
VPTLTLQPAENDLTNRDTHVADGVLANNNFGTDAYLLIGTQDVSKESQSTYRSILRFDLASIIGARIIDATLLLTASHGVLTNQAFAIHRLTQPNWTEFGASWNAYDLGHSWAAAGGDFDPTPAQSVFIPSPQNLVFDQVKPLVEDAIKNRNGMLDILVKNSSASGSQILYCYSSGDATPSNRPKLVVNYVLPVWCVETADRPVWSALAQDEGC